jgi:hypothetical protein
MRVFAVSCPAIRAGNGRVAPQQTGLDILGQENRGDRAAQRIAHPQPHSSLLDTDDEAHDPTAAHVQLLRDGLDSQTIGVNLQDECISSTTRATG